MIVGGLPAQGTRRHLLIGSLYSINLSAWLARIDKRRANDYSGRTLNRYLPNRYMKHVLNGKHRPSTIIVFLS